MKYKKDLANIDEIENVALIISYIATSILPLTVSLVETAMELFDTVWRRELLKNGIRNFLR